MGSRRAFSTAIAAVLISLAAPGAFAEPVPVDLSRALTADECVRVALERNYDILLSEDQHGQARAARLQAWGGLLPSIGADWNYTHSRAQGTLKDFPSQGSEVQFPQTRTDTRGYSIDVSHTLLSAPTLLRIVSEKRAANASASDVRNAEQLAALAVRQEFYTLIEAIKLLEVSQEDLRLASEEQKRTESLFEVGSVARTDVLKARVRVAEARSALTTAENNVDVQRGRLATSLGLSPNSPLSVVESLDPRADLVDSLAAYEEAARNRPDLSAARLRLSSASASRKSAFAAKLPSLSHRYSYGVTSQPGDYDIDPSTTETDVRYLNFKTTRWSYSIGLSWNIFDGLVTEANIIGAKARQRSAEHGMEKLSLEVELQVKEALLAIRASQRQIETAREGLASAEEDLKLSQERYSVGLGTILELIDAQVNVTRARTGEVQAMAALKRAEAGLDRAVGRQTW